MKVKITEFEGSKIKSITYSRMDLEEINKEITSYDKTYSYGDYEMEYYNNKFVIYRYNKQEEKNEEYIIFEIFDLSDGGLEND